MVLGTSDGFGMPWVTPATASEITGDELERGIEVFSRVSTNHGARPWTLEDVQPAELRIFHAKVSAHWVLDPDRRPDQRAAVDP